LRLGKFNIIPFILFIFYTVGIVGISIHDLRSLTVSLTPMNLLLTMFLLLWGNGKLNVKVISAVIVAFILGFLVEVVGVHTGVLFGSYKYGEPVGLKLFDVPLMIGVNWFLLSFSSLGLVGQLFKNRYLKVFLSSLLMVALDVLIEPIAVELDFWSWENSNIPIQNFVMWFIAAIVINYFVDNLYSGINFKVSAYVFLAQVYFFGVLNLIF